MIDLYYWTTPNGHKITMFLEEVGLPYTLHAVNIARGEQFKPEFLKIAPNNRIPAIVDQAPADGGEPLPIFESGAILEYLADKTGQFLPTAPRPRFQVLQWLYWQMGGLGPMCGQNHHFKTYAPETIQYAIDRYVNETHRLYGVMNTRLGESAYLGGDDYSIADMACWPWTKGYERQGMDLEEFPNLKRWWHAIAERPATQAAYAKGEALNTGPTISDEESRRILFGQRARS